MSVETEGKIVIKGEDAPGLSVRIVAGDDHLTIFFADDVLADYEIRRLRINALQEGFAIRAEGEDFVLTAENDVGLAEELGLVAASPRLARRIASAHNPEARELSQPPPPARSQIGAAVYGVGGLLVIGGGTFFRAASVSEQDPDLLLIGVGALMIAVAWLMTLGWRWVQGAAFAVVAGVVVVFALGIQGAGSDTARITGYAFVAGGIVLGMAGAATVNSNS